MDDRYKGPPAEPEEMPPLGLTKARVHEWLVTLRYCSPPRRDPAPFWIPADRADWRGAGLPLILPKWHLGSDVPDTPLWEREGNAVLEWLKIYTGYYPKWDRMRWPDGWYEDMAARLGLLGQPDVKFRFDDRLDEIAHTIDVSGLNPDLDLAEKTRDYSEVIRKLLDLAREHGAKGEAAAQAAEEQDASVDQPDCQGTPQGETLGPAPAAAGAPSIDNPHAEWIFARHSPRKTYSALLTEALLAPQAAVKKSDFRAAYRLVYATKNHAPPTTGWPLRSPYKERLDQEQLENSV